MQGENNRSLTTMLLVGGAFLAVYYASTYFFGDGQTAEHASEGASATTAEIAPAPTTDEYRAAARRDDPERQARIQLATITTPELHARVDNLGGGLTHVEILGERFRRAEAQLDLITTEREEYRPLRIELAGAPIPEDAVWDIEQESATSVKLEWRGNGLEVTRRIEAGTGPYQLFQTVRVKNVGNTRRFRLRQSTWHYVHRSDEGGSSMFGSRSALISQGMCRHEGETERKTRDAIVERHGWRAPIDFVGVENVYFAQVLAPASEPAEFCGLEATDRGNVDGEPEGSLFEATLVYPVTSLASGEEHVFRTLAFMGPKVPAALEQAGHSLDEVVQLGTFAIIARAFTAGLRWIQGRVGNWGVAIIILTVLVRLTLFPLTGRSFRSMAQMRRLKPEMDKISELYRDDAEKKNAAIMELYRKNGINPLAQLQGCLPALLQMPVFLALYASLSTNVELYHQPFALWWTDLSAPDPYFVLPVALGGLMWLQQRLTPMAGDPAQARVMQFMPLVFAVFMLFLPAGLCVYMLTNSVLGIAQQRFSEWRYNRSNDAPAVVSVGGGTDGGDMTEQSKDGSRTGSSVKSAASRGSRRSRRG